MKISHFLYNAFLIEDNDTKIAIDPGKNLWIGKLNSLIPETEWDDVTHVLSTHGDPDHFDFAVALTKKANAIAVCGDALAEDFEKENIKQVHKLSVGQTIQSGDVTFEGLVAEHGPLPVKLFFGLIHMLNEVAQGDHGGKKIFLGPLKILETREAMRVYSRGTIKLIFGLITLVKENIDFARGSMGFKITIGNKTIVNLGDTIFKQEWGQLKPDVLMIPIGGKEIKNTMDEAEALKVIDLMKPKTVIPCHYSCDFLWRRNINPADDEMFKRRVEEKGIQCHIMKYGDTIDIE